MRGVVFQGFDILGEVEVGTMGERDGEIGKMGRGSNGYECYL